MRLGWCYTLQAEVKKFGDTQGQPAAKQRRQEAPPTDASTTTVKAKLAVS